VGTQRPGFTEFYREAKDECLFAVLVSGQGKVVTVHGRGTYVAPER
jgi:hypothetical protein